MNEFGREERRNMEQQLNKARESRHEVSEIDACERSAHQSYHGGQASFSSDDEISLSLNENNGFDELQFCANCRRTGIPVVVVNRKDMHSRRKWASGVRFYLKEGGYDKALLCDGCFEYVTAIKSKNGDGNIVWQCFIYKILRDYSQPMELWMILPGELREWWIYYARSLSSMDHDISVECVEPLVRDGTAILQELNITTANLEDVGWKDFKKI